MKPLSTTALAALPSEDLGRSITVQLSNELVGLLSNQLYQSPLKAIEELVVNSYDADATECCIFVPRAAEDPPMVVVYDDGIGMDEAGLRNLWQIGRSNKRTEEIERRAKRKQIGKFGIGKLATYAVANRVTYLSCKDSQAWFVSLDFRQFETSGNGTIVPIQLPLSRIPIGRLRANELFVELCQRIARSPDTVLGNPTWTFTILEELKDRGQDIKLGRLRWVLRTAMPLTEDFSLYLNGEEVVSAKSDLRTITSFVLGDLPASRLEKLSKRSDVKWSKVGEAIVCEYFPGGITGAVVVTERSLYGGKSEDIARSHGFFVRVRERLVNQEDPLFGLKPLSYQLFNRFRAEIEADDLDAALTAPREGLARTEQKERFEELLETIFYEARERYEEYIEEERRKEQRKKEHDREYISQKLVEGPVADVLQGAAGKPGGTDADETWFYLDVTADDDVKEVVRALYRIPRRPFKYIYAAEGRSARLVNFSPANGQFSINADHDLVIAHGDDPRSRLLLEDIVTAEALLEVYLREEGVHPRTIGEILERRDTLLRSLANDRLFSLAGIAQALRDSSDEEHDLEIQLVAAARALGFVAAHIKNAGQPDGIARLTDYPGGEKKITLEAKSSIKEPDLSALDFAGLAEHVEKHAADGCLLVAPGYPGRSKGEESAVSRRAEQTRISCWTVEQLARVVEAAEERHISARRVLSIVLARFAPEAVTEAVEELLADPEWKTTELYKHVVQALSDLEGRLPDAARSMDLIAGDISGKPGFAKITKEEVERAVLGLAAGSKGLLRVTDRGLSLLGDIDELRRRTSGLTGDIGGPRRRSRRFSGADSDPEVPPASDED